MEQDSIWVEQLLESLEMFDVTKGNEFGVFMGLFISKAIELDVNLDILSEKLELMAEVIKEWQVTNG